jgi:hypothetical protein
MTEARKLKPIGSVHCQHYKSEARFYIEEAHPSGQRHLIVRYGEGYTGRDNPPIVDGHREFVAGIPDDWNEQDIQDLIAWPIKDPDYPAWEVPAKVYGSSELFWW